MSFSPVSHGSFSRKFDLAALLLILVAGCWFWLYFFGYGGVKLTFEDWPNQAYYLNITRLSLAHGQVPWIGNWNIHGCDKLLAIPETLMWPHVLLVPWLTNGALVTLSMCLVYCIGVWGWWRVKQSLGWSREAFLLGVVATSFNGFIISHLAAGHPMWIGALFAPWFLLGLQKVLTSEERFCWLALSFCIFFLFMLGAFHTAFWWVFFCGMAGLARPKALIRVLLGIAGGFAMSICRILPALVFMREKFEFLTGYPNLRILLNSFTQIQGYTPDTEHKLVAITVDKLGWWEFDHYVGWPLLLFVIVVAMIAMFRWHKEFPAVRSIAMASLGMAILAYGKVYSVIYSLPMFHTERMTTRFISASFVGFLFIALAGLESLREAKWRPIARLLTLGILAFAVHDAWAGAQPWLLFKLEATNPFSWYFPGLDTLTPAILSKEHQLTYQAVVIGSFSISAVMVAFMTTLSFSKKMQERVERLAGRMPWKKARV